MAFRYINPGYVNLLDSDVTATEVTGTIYSKTGVAFSQTNSSAGVTLPTFADGDDFWARFDFFAIPTAGTTAIIRCYAPCCYNSGINFYIPYFDTDSHTINYVQRGSGSTLASGTATNLNIFHNAVNSGLLHVDFFNKLVEITLNGVKYTSPSGISAFSYSTSYEKKAKLYSTNDNVYFSNIIFSDTEISPREKIIALPTSATATDMTAGQDGIYIADAANQSLLQTPDVAALIESYGAGSTVTGVAVVGNPAYRTGTGITTLTGLSKADTVITEHSSLDLSDDTIATIQDGWTISNATIADLANMQFGWRAGE